MLVELGHQVINVYQLPSGSATALPLDRQILNVAVLALVMIGLYLLKPLFETIQAAELVTLQSEAQHRALFEDSPLAIIICRDDRVEYANRAAQRIFGAARLSNMLHRPLTDFVDSRHRAFVTEQLHALTAENPTRPLAEIEALRIDQSAVDIEVLISLFLYGSSLAQYIALWDVSDRKRREATLREREAELAHVMRLHTMGEIAAEMAHEINQPLYAISNFAQASLLHLESGDPDRSAELKKCLEQIHGQAVRAGQIVKNLRNFVGKPDEAFRDVSLNPLVRGAIELVDFEARRRKAVIDGSLATLDVTIHANPVQIQQVLVNLIVNACEAMEALPAANRRVKLITCANQSQVELAVVDSGPGIAADKLTRVFEPFYSTKAQGMGMGLAVSRTIIINHGGRIWAEPNDQGGTTFHVSFPIAEQ
jgi:PAS domain S-box-containing protein